MNEPSALHIHLFGQLELDWDDRPLLPPRSAGARSLLAFLIAQADRSFPRDFLAGTFWPNRPDPRARRALGPAADCLVAEEDIVTLVLQPDDWLDVAAFEEKVSKYTGRQALVSSPNVRRAA